MKLKSNIQWAVVCLILLMHCFYVYESGGTYITGVILGSLAFVTMFMLLEDYASIETQLEILIHIMDFVIHVYIFWFASSMALVLLFIEGGSVLVGFLVAFLWLTATFSSVFTVWPPKVNDLSWLYN